jgi:bacillithiol biosynthesis deacetylase BshB1
MQLDIVFSAPHPDDVEIGCGGTVAKLVRLGYKVGIVHLTDGEPTPRGTPKTRRKEWLAAAEVLGAQVVEMLGLANRELMDGPAARYALATVLRKYRPGTLVCMAGRTPSASPDHYQSQLIAEGARFYSQLTKWDDRFDSTEPHRMDHLVYRPVGIAAEVIHFHSRFVVDISETIEQKIAAVECYKSQFAEERFDRLAHWLRGQAAAEGGPAGVDYGELYALPRPLLVQDMVGLLGTWNRPPPFPAKPKDE